MKTFNEKTKNSKEINRLLENKNIMKFIVQK